MIEKDTVSRHDMDALAECVALEASLYMTLARDQRIMTIAQADGYTDVCWLPAAGVCACRRFLFTVGVCYKLDESGFQGRFCFDTAQNARLFLKDWDGRTPPEVGVDGCKAIK